VEERRKGKQERIRKGEKKERRGRHGRKRVREGEM